MEEVGVAAGPLAGGEVHQSPVTAAGTPGGIQILPSQFPAGMLTLPVGGFLVLACLIALMQWALARPKKNKEESK